MGLSRIARTLAAGVVAVAGCRPPGYGKSDHPDAATAGDGRGSAGDGGPVLDAAADAAGVCNATFLLPNRNTASSVWLTGDFVAWATSPASGAIAMTKDNAGTWSGVRVFTAGTYLYKFIVDTNMWIADPTNPDQVPDGVGGNNSVYHCAP